MTETEYWKFKCKLFELRLEEQQLQLAIQDVNNRKDNLAREYNIEPGVPYKFNDKEFTIEKIDGK